jgi:polysaccharide pyruvyl transferase WcaK-like protein
VGSRSQRIAPDVPGLWEEYATWLEGRGVERPRFVVDGRFGVGRFESDATLHVLLGRIRAALPTARVHVVCPGAATIRRRYHRDERVSAAAPHGPLSLKAIARCHVYVVGGGDLSSLQTSLTGAAAEISTRIPRVYLAVLATRARGARSCFHSVAFSRPPTGVQRVVAQRAFQAADVVAARDSASLRHLQALAERGVVRVEHPVLALEAESEEVASEVLRYWGSREDERPLVALACTGGDPARVRAVAACARHLIERRGCRVLFVPFDHDETNPRFDDLAFGRLVRAELGRQDSFAVVEGAYSPPVVAALIGRVRAVVTTRLDAALLADRGGTPFVAVTDSDEFRTVLGERRHRDRRVPAAHLEQAGGCEWLDQQLFASSGS